jgi:hypothetical protein
MRLENKTFDPGTHLPVMSAAFSSFSNFCAPSFSPAPVCLVAFAQRALTRSTSAFVHSPDTQQFTRVATNLFCCSSCSLRRLSLWRSLVCAGDRLLAPRCELQLGYGEHLRFSLPFFVFMRGVSTLLLLSVSTLPVLESRHSTFLCGLTCSLTLLLWRMQACVASAIAFLVRLSTY